VATLIRISTAGVRTSGGGAASLRTADNIKVLLMRGKLFRSKGQGIAGCGRKMRVPVPNDFNRGTGTITNCRIVDREIMSQMGNLNIESKNKPSKKKVKRNLVKRKL
jgi:hypothetical protein